MDYDWSLLAQGRQARRYRAGQLIYLQGGAADRFYYLTEGTARSFISSAEGTERLLTVHRAGDLMGEASFFDECPRVSSAAALTDCKAVTIDRDWLDAVFFAHPELAYPMLRYLARTVRMLSGHVDDISFRPAEQRLARYLLSLPAQDRAVSCTHQELAEAIGASRVTVSRIMSGFERRGLVQTGYGRVTFLDGGALATLAEGQKP